MGQSVWDEWGSLWQARPPPPLQPSGLWGGGASPPSASGRHGAPLTGLDVAASERGAESQNPWGWMGDVGRGREDEDEFVSDEETRRGNEMR